MKRPASSAASPRRITRRNIIAATGAGVAASLLVGTSARGAANKSKPLRSADGRWTRLRRVVTSEDATGRGVLLQDGEPANGFELNGTRITRLWETGSTPVPLPLLADAGATAGNAYRQGFVGTSFYVAELPGGTRAPSIPMHRNPTVDYMAILSGRIVLRIEQKDIELGPGDTIVQGGNLHTWINRWKEPCLLLFVVVTGASAAAG